MSGWGLGILLASLKARAAERRERVDARYQADIARLEARGLHWTAARVRAERRAWLLSGGGEG